MDNPARDTTTAKGVIDFLGLVGKLKHVKRTGWVREGVKDPECIAGHMYRMGIMSFLLKDDPKLDYNRCIKLSLVHDLAECIVGDITPQDGVPKEVKHQKEREAMEQLGALSNLPGPSSEMKSLWEEYENQNTPEAKAVKDLDRFDMILQAFEYETDQNRPGELQDFFTSTAGSFQHPVIKQWVEQLYLLRNKPKE